MHRFSWINEWKERVGSRGRPQGLELILPDWFYAGIMADAFVLTIDRAYFDLTGGLERWLYRLWSFDFRHLHLKSGSLSPFKRFAFELRARFNASGRLPERRRSKWNSRRTGLAINERSFIHRPSSAALSAVSRRFSVFQSIAVTGFSTGSERAILRAWL